MPRHADQILTVAQMRDAEQALIAAGISAGALMHRAGQRAAEYVWRLAAHRHVTVLCGPGNNGGDGYVIAQALSQRGGQIRVIAATEPRSEAALAARAAYRGLIMAAADRPRGEVLVDCLFGSGLSRPLSDEHEELLASLLKSHRRAIAIDLPSGIDADTGEMLNTAMRKIALPVFDMTVALGGWKFAHFLMPSCGAMGEIRLVDIGVGPVAGAATQLSRPRLVAPGASAHKYRRGLLAVIGGAMPGAALLACEAAQGAGAGYVKLVGGSGSSSFGLGQVQHAIADTGGQSLPPDLVLDVTPISNALTDPRIAALLIGPGLGRGADSFENLEIALAANLPTVLDADALMLLFPRLLNGGQSPLVATPHDGELTALERAFGLPAAGSKASRAAALARHSGMVVVAKGPDTVIATPDGRIVCAPRASSWLSTAGTGDVLAGVVASRLASGADGFAAACEGVWLHGEAARLCGPAFSASQLAAAIPAAFGACL